MKRSSPILKEPKHYEDFSHEYIGKKCYIVTPDMIMETVVEDATRYWIKIRVKPGDKPAYLNKAWIIYLRPLE